MTAAPPGLPVARYIDAVDRSPLMFTVCALVADQGRYDRLLASFARLGFTPETTEFLAADNRNGNQFDGYTWHRTLLAQARGHFVIFCHDDIELIEDGYDTLLQRLRDLDQLDPNWLLAGVAGGVWLSNERGAKGLALRISDNGGEDRRYGVLPCRVEALDECFMLMRRLRPVLPSYDLSGFHFYGPDLCLQAELAGGTAYAIDFHISHHGRGVMGEPFDQSLAAFTRKYRAYFPLRSLRCTTGFFPFSAEAEALMKLREQKKKALRKRSLAARLATRLGWPGWSG